MRRFDKFFLGALLVAVGIIGGLSVVDVMARGSDVLAETEIPISVLPGDIVFGPSNAPKTILGFVSLTCVHCRRWEIEEMPVVLRELVGTGQVKLVIRDFPLDEPALMGAALVRCLPVETRAAAHTLLIERQEVWASGGIIAAENVLGLKSAGAADAAACAQREDIRKELAESVRQSSVSYGVKATPTFVAGRRIVSGMSASDMAEALKSAP